MVDSVMEAQTNLREAGIEVEIEEAVADKGYHATDTLELADCAGHSHLYSRAEDRRESGTGSDVPEEKRRAVLNNRRRMRGARSKRLQRLRSERVERSFAQRRRLAVHRHRALRGVRARGGPIEEVRIRGR